MKRKKSIRANSIPSFLIAACGMNCGLCMAYVRAKKACPGCRGDDTDKSKSCIACHIKNCMNITGGKIKYCFACENFPCARLVHLDKRYRTKYSMSMLENLEAIRSKGIRNFVENEKKRWECPECGGLLCVHKSECIHCHRVWRKIAQRKKPNPGLR
jgi:hypothetical protein